MAWPYRPGERIRGLPSLTATPRRERRERCRDRSECHGTHLGHHRSLLDLKSLHGAVKRNQLTMRCYLVVHCGRHLHQSKRAIQKRVAHHEVQLVTLPSLGKTQSVDCISLHAAMVSSQRVEDGGLQPLSEIARGHGE